MRARSRTRSARGSAAAHFRPFLSSGFRPQSNQRRPGTGARHRAPLGRAAQREADGAERQSRTTGDHRIAAPARNPQAGTEARYSGFSNLMLAGNSNRSSFTLGSSTFAESA